VWPWNDFDVVSARLTVDADHRNVTGRKLGFLDDSRPLAGRMPERMKRGRG
jgi:hypothetical protein